MAGHRGIPPRRFTGIAAADPDRHARHLAATAARAPLDPAGQFPAFAGCAAVARPRRSGNW
ncbi:hypothetical protein Rwratislav_33677, partial [Rhodococcus wratislaviensis IFP 2016]